MLKTPSPLRNSDAGKAIHTRPERSPNFSANLSWTPAHAADGWVSARGRPRRGPGHHTNRGITMSSTTLTQDLAQAVDAMTGAVDVVEAAFTPWDLDQLVELEVLLAELGGIDALDAAVLDLD